MNSSMPYATFATLIYLVLSLSWNNGLAPCVSLCFLTFFSAELLLQISYPYLTSQEALLMLHPLFQLVYILLQLWTAFLFLCSIKFCVICKPMNSTSKLTHMLLISIANWTDPCSTLLIIHFQSENHPSTTNLFLLSLSLFCFPVSQFAFDSICLHLLDHPNLLNELPSPFSLITTSKKNLKSNVWAGFRKPKALLTIPFDFSPISISWM